MKKILVLALLISLFSWNRSYSQSVGADIVIVIDNSYYQLSDPSYQIVKSSAGKLVETLLNCNSNNRVAVAQYGMSQLSDPQTAPYYFPKVYLESDFTTDPLTALSFSRRFNSGGSMFHETLGLLENALTGTANPAIVSPVGSLSRNPAVPLIFVLFTTSERNTGGWGGGYLVNYYSTNYASNNNAKFQNVVNLKNNMGANFAVVLYNSNQTAIDAAATIASTGGSYYGITESYDIDPDGGHTPRILLQKPLYNFQLTQSEITDMATAICTILPAKAKFYFEPREWCYGQDYPLPIFGTIALPQGASVSNIKLRTRNIFTGAVYPANTVGSVVGNDFSFFINQGDLTNPQTGAYQFEVYLEYSNGLTTGSVVNTNSYPFFNYDLSYDCCNGNDVYVTNPVLPSSSDSQASMGGLVANNIIYNTATASYHAGDYVILKDGFYARSGSDVHIFAKPCFQQGSRNANISNSTSTQEPTLMTSTGPAPAIKTIKVSPNPNNGLFKIILDKSETGTLQIADMNGKTVLEKSFSNEKEISVSLERQLSGTYIIKAITKSGISTGKTIKK